MTALTLLGSSSACIQCLSQERQLELQTIILYEILLNGIGGGGTGIRYVFGPDDGAVGTIVPLGGVAIYVDTDRVYYWFGGAWH